MSIQFPLYRLLYTEKLDPPHDHVTKYHTIEWYQTDKEAQSAAKRWNKNHRYHTSEVQAWHEADFKAEYKQFQDDFDPSPQVYDDWASCPDYDSWLYDWIDERKYYHFEPAAPQSQQLTKQS